VSLRAVVTNLWSKLRVENGRVFSRVVVETTRPAPWRVTASGRDRIAMRIDGGVALACGVVPVHDGLLEEVRVTAEQGAEVELSLDHPAHHYLHDEEGVPHRIVVDIDRESLAHVLSGRRIVLAPGHGGGHPGYSGPVNLLEKDVVLAIAADLGRLLSEAGAGVLYTRRTDSGVPWSQRVALAGAGDLYISLHAGAGRSGCATGYPPGSPSSLELARLVLEKLAVKTHLAGGGTYEAPHLADLGPVPAVEVQAVTITDWVEEGLLRSPTFRSKVAQGVFNGLVSYLWRRHGDAARGKPAALIFGKRPPEANTLSGVIPVRTHLVTEGDDLFELVERYTKDVAEPGDVVVLAESMVAITQGRAVPQQSVRPGPLATFLSRFPAKDGSLATPHAMQLAIEEAGAPRVLLGAAAAAVGRPFGRRGDFYRVAGRHLALIDDVAGTMWPYEKHIILGPRDPDRLAGQLKERLGVDVVVVDVNDIRCVDILGASSGVDRRRVSRALLSNPLGNDDQQTPLAVIKGAAVIGRARPVW